MSPGRKMYFSGVATHTYTPEWKSQRSVAMMILRSLGYGQKTTEYKILEEAQTMIKEINATKQQYFDPSKLIHTSVTNVICYLLFNEKYAHDDAEFEHLLKALHSCFTQCIGNQKLSSIPLYQYLPTHKKSLNLLQSATDTLHAFILNKIEQRKAALNTGEHGDDFIQVNVKMCECPLCRKKLGLSRRERLVLL